VNPTAMHIPSPSKGGNLCSFSITLKAIYGLLLEKNEKMPKDRGLNRGKIEG
jgi:hypothetical protein